MRPTIGMKWADAYLSTATHPPAPAWFLDVLRAAQIEDWSNAWAAKGAEYAILQLACEALGIEGLL